ncbi:hypothetical protein SHKM778_48950 [Streptomyces sp. KM77-8]|uniref:Cytochrome P450 n=1 Tax=Streptomyces haneummycinicus TaxID=3074435 RepID=A0AAT9HM66_9ACTN
MTATPDAVPLYGPEHAADPRHSFELLRAQGPVGRAEIDPGLVVWVITDYRAALDLLQDSANWTKDTRGWDTTVPADSPVREPCSGGPACSSPTERNTRICGRSSPTVSPCSILSICVR